MLDELMAAGEIGWSGAGALPGKDGWLSLHLAESAELLRPEPVPLTRTPLHQALLDALAGGYGLFFRQLVEQVPEVPQPEVAAALWDLIWAGHVTNDTLGPVRALLGSARTAGATAHRAPRAVPRGRYGAAVSRAPRLDPTVGGRWSLLPEPAGSTARAAAQAQVLLDRHGVLTRGTVQAERIQGGFAGVYRVLSAFEERGRARRGYLVEGLGGAQFAMDGAVDRLRSVNGRLERAGATEWPGGAAGGTAEPQTQVLAAADPANAYGAALPWPEPPGEQAKAHRPGRKAGALVVLVDGELVLYVERGGKSLLSWAEVATDGVNERLDAAVRALAGAVRQGLLSSVTVERANGEPALTSPLGAVLEAAGFHPTTRGLRLRG
jgi:ATP-dependent Lhr-like helicase